MKQTLLFIVLLLLLISSSNTIYSQELNENLSFQHIESGMSQSSATEIFEDSFGFLWIGTQNGLNNYDGKDFQIYEKSQDGITGLTNGQIEDLYEDDENELHIATAKGLNTYNRKLDKVKPYPFIGEGESIKSKHFMTLVKSSGFLWLGTRNGLYRYNTTSGETKKLYFQAKQENLLTKNNIVKVAKLNNNKILLVTNVGLYILNNELQILAETSEDHIIRHVLQLNENNFLIGLENGELLEVEVAKNNTLNIQRTNITNGYVILSIATDINNNYWLGSENGGLFIYSKLTGEITNLKTNNKKANSISSNSIWSLHKNKQGTMWMGPFKKGISFYDSDYYKFNHIKNDPFNSLSLSNNNTNCFIEDEKENLWIGTDGGGLNYWDRASNSFEQYNLDNNKFNSNVVLSLIKDSKGKLWVGSWDKGLTIFDTATKKYEVLTTENSFLLSNHVMDIVEDNKGQIWIVSLFGGLQVYNPKTKTHKNIDLRYKKNEAPITATSQILQDKKGNIWVGTQTSGVYKLNEANGSWSYSHYSNLENEKTISSNYINTIIQDSKETIWIGSQAGLNKYNESTDSFEMITKKDGLINDAIKGIVEDKNGLLWLSTGNGIIHYNPNTSSSLNYDKDDGLQGHEFNSNSSYSTRKNELIFGGSNGFNIFKPEEIKKRYDKPKVIIEGLKIFNQPILPGDDSKILNQHISQVDTLNLAYDQSVINFEFVALTFHHPEKVKYAYFLDGFETDWNYVGTKKSATYTNLSPGNYTLRLKSSNSDGVWNTNETKLKIIITPPLWKTWWFRLICIALLAIGFFVIHNLRIRNIKKHQVLLEEKIDDRTKQLQLQKEQLEIAADELTSKNQEIQRFAYAVSHDLKSPLSGIKGIARLIPMEFVIKDFPELEKYLEMINISCDTMNDLIADITQIAKIGKIENKNEILDTNEIVKLSTTLIKGKLNMRNVQLEVDENLPDIYGDRNRIIQVFGNLLDNAIKYMGNQEKPLVSIKGERTGERIQFSIIDNGSGMNKKSLEKLFSPFERFHSDVNGTGLGLYMIKQIIESHDGSITAESEGKQKGATFKVNLPNAIIREDQEKRKNNLVTENS